MSPHFEPKRAILPPAQREIWPQLAPAPALSFVLYGGTAIALHLGHRQSLDFDLFNAEALDKTKLRTSFPFTRDAQILKEDPQTLVVSAKATNGPVRISFFGAIGIGHVNPPLRTDDEVLLVASLDDLMATKLKAILDRAEAKDYADIAAMLAAGISLEKALGTFSAMFNADPGLALRALAFFKDGDLPTLPRKDQDLLRAARDRVVNIPAVPLTPGLLA
jgi:Nucleotidyl transferase AbiEii toxin, Type IV TA system